MKCCNTFQTKTWIQEPRASKSCFKERYKVTWKEAWKRIEISSPGAQATFKIRSRNQPKIDENPALDPLVSILLIVLQGAPEVPE